MILVDASVYIFRAYHSLPDTITGRDGAPLNAVYGFADFLCALLEGARPSRIAVAFDESLETSFRNDIYPPYKANRETAPADLKAQIAACRALVHALGIVAVSSDRYEADDLIGTLAARADAAVTIVSSDKDLAQLLGAGDVLWDYARGMRYDPAAIRVKFGVACAQIPDYLGLVGDPVDNVPGVAGIGAKTAAGLLAEHPDLDALYANLDGLAGLPLRGAAGIRAKLEAGRESAFLSRSLCTIVTDAPLPAAAGDPTRGAADPRAIAALCDELGVGERLQARLTGQELR